MKKQVVIKAERGEWFTLQPDGVVYRLVKTGPNTAKYETVARNCSVDDARRIAALPAMEAALAMFIAWDDNTHGTAPSAQHDLAMKAARAAMSAARGEG